MGPLGINLPAGNVNLAPNPVEIRLGHGTGHGQGLLAREIALKLVATRNTRCQRPLRLFYQRCDAVDRCLGMITGASLQLQPQLLEPDALRLHGGALTGQSL
jgi:hypothetical protein